MPARQQRAYRLPRPAAWGMWAQGEVVAMATDVAEFIGAALGLNLLFGVPMLPAGLITALTTFAVMSSTCTRP
jgi:manganese transport protein